MKEVEEEGKTMHPYYHSVSSARKFGGIPEDYQKIHDWFDASKAHFHDFRHRALRHHTEGIFFCESVFGTTIINSEGKHVPVRLIGEQHVKEDLGFVPTLAMWLSSIEPKAWMMRTNVTSQDVMEGQVQEMNTGDGGGSTKET